VEGSQLTFDDLNRHQTVLRLNKTQRSILNLLSKENCTQGQISRILKVSRSYVSQTVRSLEWQNLLKKTVGKQYNCFYDVAPGLKEKTESGKPIKITAVRVHNVREKYKIISQNRPVSKDKRTGFSKEWTPRGGKRYKYWYPGSHEKPSVTIDVHPRTIVVYLDKSQTIIAETRDAAEHKAWQYVHDAVKKFVELQHSFGVKLEVEQTGKQISRVHNGFALSGQNKVVKEGVTLDNWWIDKSVSEVEPGKVELETTDREGATRLDKMILASEQFDHLPAMIKGVIDPLNQNIKRVEALIQGERTDGQKVVALMDVVGQLLTRMIRLEEKLEQKR
jgi:hypothetical protein